MSGKMTITWLIKETNNSNYSNNNNRKRKLKYIYINQVVEESKQNKIENQEK